MSVRPSSPIAKGSFGGTGGVGGVGGAGGVGGVGGFFGIIFTSGGFEFFGIAGGVMGVFGASITFTEDSEPKADAGGMEGAGAVGGVGGAEGCCVMEGRVRNEGSSVVKRFAGGFGVVARTMDEGGAPVPSC